MQYVAPNGLKFYYSKKVYSPEFTSLGSVLLVNKLVKDGGNPSLRILDAGCGSGVLGLSIKAANPFTTVTLCDVESEAVRVSRLNSRRLGLSCVVYVADILPVFDSWDIIVANLPTFTPLQMKTSKLHGPDTAYLAGDDPLAIYRKLFKKAKGRCKALVAECQIAHQKDFFKMAKQEGYKHILTSGDFCFAFSAN